MTSPHRCTQLQQASTACVHCNLAVERIHTAAHKKPPQQSYEGFGEAIEALSP